MKTAVMLVLMGWMLTPTLSAQTSAGGETDLRQNLKELRGRLERSQQRVEKLVRMRVAQDLLLPVGETEVLEGTTPVLPRDQTGMKTLLEKESGRTRELRERLAKLLRKSPHARLEEPASHRQPPDARPVPRPAPPTRKIPVPKYPIAPSLAEHDVIPRRSAAEAEISQRQVPIVVDPLQAGGELRLRIEPARDPLKRVSSLLDADLPRRALVVLELLLADEKEAPALLFLKAKALERSGLDAQAREMFDRVAKTDVEQGESGESIPGPWAEAARGAVAHLDWKAQTASLQIPDLETLRW